MELYELFRRHSRISTDSRHIVPDSLFFALHGERFDGNSYAENALKAGAAAAVVDDPSVAETLRQQWPDRCAEVPDTLAALQELAARHRRELGIPILAITGSNGKTTTKELVGRVLSRKFRTAVTQGNLNNHIGVPLTLLAMDRSVEIGVVEMGASHPGEIALLCSIARPDYGLITNIGKAHLEGFGGIEGVMRGKGELLDFMVASGGTAFWLNDSDCLKTMVESRPGLRAISYSAPEAIGTEPFVEARWDGLSVRTRLAGDYNRSNIAAAIAVGLYFRIGTPISSLIEYGGGMPEDTGKIVNGGPMMGRAVANPEAPVTKGTSGILLIRRKGSVRKTPQSCIKCAKCVGVCPMGLEPYLMYGFARRLRYEELEATHVTDCIECGCCSYTCPAYLPLLDYIRLGKSEVAKILRARKAR